MMSHSEPAESCSPASLPLEDYAFIGNGVTAALVSRGGSMDWFCLPAMRDRAVFARLLGDASHGYWEISADGEATRRYLPNTLILETRWETSRGVAVVSDALAASEAAPGTAPTVIRSIRGVSGEVAMRFRFVPRFSYGRIFPAITSEPEAIHFVAGPDRLILHGDIDHLETEEAGATGDFSVSAGTCCEFLLSWTESYAVDVSHPSPTELLEPTRSDWEEWCQPVTFEGFHRDSVLRSLQVVRALTHPASGGIVAAPTTSLPESPGGSDNWDYRFCWIRDSTVCLRAQIHCGYYEEAERWLSWLLRAAAGSPELLQPFYDVNGARNLPEFTLEWLPGWCGSQPVRIGNQAHIQLQIDIYGEFANCLHVATVHGIEVDENDWQLEHDLMLWLEDHWHRPDCGFWELRESPRHHVHSKAMASVAFNRASQAIRRGHYDGPAARWEKLSQTIRDEVIERGFDARRGTFCETYDSCELDATALLLPITGFIEAGDPRMISTMEILQSELGSSEGGLYRRTADKQNPSPQGTFIACGFWLAECLTLAGRRDDAIAQFERMDSLANDLGLLSEEYDPRKSRLIGNFPQVLSHVALINAAHTIQDPRCCDSIRGRNPA